MSYAITAGQTADITTAPRLVRPLPKRVHTVVGDKAYDSDPFIRLLHLKNRRAVIPPRRNRRVRRRWARSVYRRRHLVENYFARLKHFRRLATRYDKRVRSWRGFFLAANVLLQVGARVSRSPVTMPTLTVAA